MSRKQKSDRTALVLWGATDLGPPHFSGDMLWRTGFKAPDPFVMVEIDGKKGYALVPPLEIGRATKEASKDIEIINAYDYKTKSRGYLENFLKKHGVGKLIVPDVFPCGLKDQLAKSFKIIAVETPFYPQRAVKTDWAVHEIERAQRAVERAVAEAMKWLKDCVVLENNLLRHALCNQPDSMNLRAVIDDELYKQGYLGIDTIVACGIQAADPHCKGFGPLHAYQPIIIDVFPLSLETHYYADMTRTVFKGEPSDELKKMYQAVLDAQNAAISMVKDGVDGREIYGRVLVIFDGNGYSTCLKEKPYGFIHSVGHGVGIDMHEPPFIGSKKDILREGNVVTVEPGLYYPEAKNGIPAGGIRIEDMVLVTKEGCRNLTKFPKDLESAIIL